MPNIDETDIKFARRQPNRAQDVIEAIEDTSDLTTLEEYIEQDIHLPLEGGQAGTSQYTAVQEALLHHDALDLATKERIAEDVRGDALPETRAVSDDVHQRALTALNVGKPVVLYGPTGTGKTTYAQQLAAETSIDYVLETATPNWTPRDIVGGPAVDYESDGEYTKRAGCVSRAVQQARKFGGPYSVIIDELTRADISVVFGELYTAIENPSQTIFTTDGGERITLDNAVNIICTMNVSDRTVNELDDAITRRFAMIKVDAMENVDVLFGGWVDDASFSSAYLEEALVEDYEALNGFDGGERITEFGPMHYKDVVDFVEEALEADTYDEMEAIDAAYATYIIPRLLNSASLETVDQLVDHYERLAEDSLKPNYKRSLGLLKDERRKKNMELQPY